MPNKIKIHVKHFIKKFGVKEVLKGIDLDIYEGESIVILGGSGCGKTILIKILASLLTKTSGRIKVYSKNNPPRIILHN